MTTVAALNRRLKNLQIKGEAKKVIALNTNVARELNIEQITHGLNSDNTKIGTYKSIHYKRYKQSLNILAGGFVDLILTGRSVNSIQVKLNNNVIDFKMTDDRYDLIKRYGKEVLGLSDNGLQEFINHITPLFIKAVKGQLKL